MPAVPGLDDIKGFAKARQALKRAGRPPCGAAWRAPPAQQSPCTKSFRAWDTKVRSGQTAMLGLGRRVSPKSPRANEMLLAVGFHLFTNSMANVTAEGEKAYDWPESTIIKSGVQLRACAMLGGTAEAVRGSLQDAATC